MTRKLSLRARRRVASGLASLALALVASAPVSAHDLGFTRTTILLFADGTFRVDMVVDLDALALGVAPSTDNAEIVAVLTAMTPEELAERVAGLRSLFLRRVRIRFDDAPVTPQVAFPQQTDRPVDRRPLPDAAAAPTLIGLIARLEGSVPAGAEELTFQASRSFPTVHLAVVDLRQRGITRAEFDEAMLDVPTAGRQVLELGDRSDPYPLERPPAAPSRLGVARQYLGLGFEHIVPLGIDHIFFVLGLYMLNTAWRPLLAQVTAFTVAHTATLALSTYGIVSLSPRVVEPLIALSIAYVAIENLATTELKPWRPALVFGFGLLHGLGFAGVLAELGLPRGEYLTALLSFNLGVELGQLAVIGVAFALIGWAGSRGWYRQRIAVPVSGLIGVVGLYWTAQRLLG